MKSCLVTGGAGFIGSNFVHYLLARHRDLTLVNLDKLTYAGNPDNLLDLRDEARHVFVRGDICDSALVEELFRTYRFDTVIHMAAESHVDRSITGPEVFVQTNVLGTVNLLQRAKDAWYLPDEKRWLPGRKFVQVSTDEVYGTLDADGCFTEESPIAPRSPYSASKAAADHFVRAFHATYGMPVNITRCSNNYGPCQYPEKLIPRMIDSALHHRPLPVYGDGLQQRDWLYVEDHCRAIELGAERGRPGEVYNVGGHNERDNLTVVRLILGRLRERLGDPEISEALINHVEDRPGHDRRYSIDPTKIGAELGWAPETPFEEGILRTIDWYLANRTWMDRVISGACRAGLD